MVNEQQNACNEVRFEMKNVIPTIKQTANKITNFQESSCRDGICRHAANKTGSRLQMTDCITSAADSKQSTDNKYVAAF